jgi:hypothetical protein
MRDRMSGEHDQPIQHMKNKLNPITRLAALTVASVLVTGAATAATTSGKGGMQSTYAQGHTDGQPMLAPGVQTFNVGGFLNWDSPTTYGLNVSYGRFISSNVQVGLMAQLAGVNSDKSYGLAPFVEYNFLTGTPWVPYVSANVGYWNPSGGSHSLEAGLDVGAKYFFRPNIAIFGEVGGSWHLSGTRGNSDGFRKQLVIGTSFYF